MKFSIKDFFSKCDKSSRKLRILRIWSHSLRKSLVENFIFCIVSLKFALVLEAKSGDDPQITSECAAWKVPVFGVILVRISHIRTEYREVLRISPYSVRMPKKTDQNNFEYGEIVINLKKEEVYHGNYEDFQTINAKYFTQSFSHEAAFYYHYIITILPLYCCFIYEESFTAQNWSFPLRISSINVTKSAVF